MTTTYTVIDNIADADHETTLFALCCDQCGEWVDGRTLPSMYHGYVFICPACENDNMEGAIAAADSYGRP